MTPAARTMSGPTRTATSRPGSTAVSLTRGSQHPATMNHGSGAIRHRLQNLHEINDDWSAESAQKIACLPLVATGVSCAAADSSLTEQAGNSQKSFKCVPCSRTYILDAHVGALTQ